MRQFLLFTFLFFFCCEGICQRVDSTFLMKLRARKCPLIIGGQVTLNKDSIGIINLCKCFDTAQSITYDMTASKQGACQTMSTYDCNIFIKPFNHGDLILLQNIIALYPNGKKKKFPSTRINIK